MYLLIYGVIEDLMLQIYGPKTLTKKESKYIGVLSNSILGIVVAPTNCNIEKLMDQISLFSDDTFTDLNNVFTVAQMSTYFSDRNRAFQDAVQNVLIKHIHKRMWNH